MAHSAAHRAAAPVRREVSITGWAHRLMADAATRRPALRGSREEGVYILSQEEVRRGRRMDTRGFTAPDGYVRRSPVQELVVDPGYRGRLIARGVGFALAAVLVVLVLYVLARFDLMGF